MFTVDAPRKEAMLLSYAKTGQIITQNTRISIPDKPELAKGTYHSLIKTILADVSELGLTETWLLEVLTEGKETKLEDTNEKKSEEETYIDLADL